MDGDRIPQCGNSVAAEMPKGLVQAVERFILGVTEDPTLNLDPVVALKVTGLMKQLCGLAYTMGFQDGSAKPPESKQWNLGELIEGLSKIQASPDCWVSFDFGGHVPTRCASWRGVYSQIAIGYTKLEWDERPKLKAFLQHLRESIARPFSGYKGGTFFMDESTPVWVDNYGDCTSCGVVGLDVEIDGAGKVYHAIILTRLLKRTGKDYVNNLFDID